MYNSNDTTFTCVAESDLPIVYTWLKDWREAQNNRWQQHGAFYSIYVMEICITCIMVNNEKSV